jgi:hypothetical protein
MLNENSNQIQKASWFGFELTNEDSAFRLKIAFSNPSLTLYLVMVEIVFRGSRVG